MGVERRCWWSITINLPNEKDFRTSLDLQHFPRFQPERKCDVVEAYVMTQK